MARRRRKKTSSLRSLFLWAVCLALVGWGLWQADQMRRSLRAVPPPAYAASTDPNTAVEGMSAPADPGQMAPGTMIPPAIAGRGVPDVLTSRVQAPAAY